MFELLALLLLPLLGAVELQSFPEVLPGRGRKYLEAVAGGGRERAYEAD